MEIHAPPALIDPKDTEHLRLLATFHYVVAGILALFACFPLIHVTIGIMMIVNPGMMTGSENQTPPPAAIGYLFLGMGLFFVLLGWAMAICTFLSGRYLKRRERRMFSFVNACILCLFTPLGTALGIFTILVLSRESVKQLYAGTTV